MKTRNKASLGLFVMPALVFGAMAILTAPANAGNAHGKDGNPGQSNGHAENGGPAGTNNGNGNMASARGSLNAAHASANGLEHANRDHSRVGMLANYMDAMVVYEEFIEEKNFLLDGGALEDDDDVVAAQTAADAELEKAKNYLEGAANKEIDSDVVDAVNGLLDGKSEDFTHSDIIHESEEDIVDLINLP